MCRVHGEFHSSSSTAHLTKCSAMWTSHISEHVLIAQTPQPIYCYWKKGARSIFLLKFSAEAKMSSAKFHTNLRCYLLSPQSPLSQLKELEWPIMAFNGPTAQYMVYYCFKTLVCKLTTYVADTPDKLPEGMWWNWAAEHTTHCNAAWSR